jgi:alpha-acetolactate decarboxylase
MRATTAPLAQAAAVQPEFSFNDVDGALEGLWAPQFSSAFNVAGYHFHFLSADRIKGGHLLDCSGNNLRVRVESEDANRPTTDKNPEKTGEYHEGRHS